MDEGKRLLRNAFSSLSITLLSILTDTQPIELASDKERYIMELKKKETSDFFKEMENNIHKTFTKAKKASEFDDSLFTELNAEEMYEFDEDHYDDNMDGHLSNSVNSYPEGMSHETYFVSMMMFVDVFRQETLKRPLTHTTTDNVVVLWGVFVSCAQFLVSMVSCVQPRVR